MRCRLCYSAVGLAGVVFLMRRMLINELCLKPNKFVEFDKTNGYGLACCSFETKVLTLGQSESVSGPSRLPSCSGSTTEHWRDIAEVSKVRATKNLLLVRVSTGLL